MMKPLTLLCGLILGLSSSLWASDLQTQPSTLYPYQNSIELQDDFLTGTTTSGSVGDLGWISGGTVSLQASTANRIGLIRLETSAASGAIARINFNNTASIDPANATILRWLTQLNTNDVNTTVRMGAQNATTGNPPADGIYLEKLDADTNWFCVTRAAAVETRTDSTVAVSTSPITMAYTRNSSGVQFTINSVTVCGLHTTNIPTVFLSAEAFIINSAAANKTIDIDYFSLRVTNLVR